MSEQDRPTPPSWRPSGFVTLLTDFGISDTYVGVMKGVLARHHPRARAVDLTHAVPPQDVRAAALHLSSAWTWFPHGSVHVCVVDPGVGSGRRILVGEECGHAFLAPDNGLLSGVLSPDAPLYELDLEALDRFLADRLAKFKRPRSLHVLEALPLTPSGKVQKFVLSERFG